MNNEMSQALSPLQRAEIPHAEAAPAIQRTATALNIVVETAIKTGERLPPSVAIAYSEAHRALNTEGDPFKGVGAPHEHYIKTLENHVEAQRHSSGAVDSSLSQDEWRRADELSDRGSKAVNDVCEDALLSQTPPPFEVTNAYNRVHSRLNVDNNPYRLAGPPVPDDVSILEQYAATRQQERAVQSNEPRVEPNDFGLRVNDAYKPRQSYPNRPNDRAAAEHLEDQRTTIADHAALLTKQGDSLSVDTVLPENYSVKGVVTKIEPDCFGVQIGPDRIVICSNADYPVLPQAPMQKVEIRTDQDFRPSLHLTDNVRNAVESRSVVIEQSRKAIGPDCVVVEPAANGRYSGKVVAQAERHTVQDIGGKSVVIHRNSALDSVPAPGHNVTVKYHNGRGTMVDRTQDLARGKNIGMQR